MSGQFLDKLGGLLKIFVPDKSAKQDNQSNEVEQIQKSYQAEFIANEKHGFFNVFVDGINRLVRPIFSFGVMGFFVWAAVDPIDFTAFAVTLAVIPQMMWWILITIIGFWFGGRLLEKAPKYTPPTAEQINAVLNARAKIFAARGKVAGAPVSIRTRSPGPAGNVQDIPIINDTTFIDVPGPVDGTTVVPKPVVPVNKRPTLQPQRPGIRAK